MNRRKLFWLTMLIALAMSITLAQAGPGTLAPPVNLPAPYGAFGTYYANSPAGTWSYPNALGVPVTSDSGTPLRKFVDSLPGLGVAGANTMGNYIPVATVGINPVPGDPADYYEIEVKDYNQQLHRDLPGPLNATYPGPGTKLRGYRDLNGPPGTRPYYLGPLIIAKSYDPTKAANSAGNGAPVRIKFVNNLGASNGVDGPGDLFLPVDETAMGAGLGPLSYTVDPATGLVTKNAFNEKYRQNRAELHLHGGVTPWISDGTPHQWFTPVGDSNPANNSYIKGVSQVNVPDMPDPGVGAGTYYYSNQQSARLMFYHDHAFGLTRLNVYAGEAAGYLLIDQTEQDMIAAGVLPDNGGGYNTYGIPLIIQDKTFVPKDVAIQDAKWTNPLWGTYGDLWMSHVYEPNQNPNDLSGANPYGRWDYGPWFWPPVTIGANYLALPGTGASDISLTPESFNDTPIVNGAAYPFLNVEPKAYRFRVLNAANDRPFNLQLYVSDPASADNVLSGSPTEVAMLPAAKWAKCTAASLPATPAVPLNCSCTAAFSPLGCTPATWPTDGRDGGAPDPQFIGPSMIQIGTEGGLLPSPVVIPNQPVNYDYNRRNIVVLDILYKALLLAPAERADVLIDFTKYAGKTIILYNDAPAPMPAFDARFDYFTNAMDQTPNGGAPSTLPGFGPNTRTIMQFRVGATAGTPFTYDATKMAALTTAINSAFAATQPKPIVPESAYQANYPADTSPNLVPGKDVYSTIFANSLTFTPIGAAAGTLPVTVNFLSKAIQELWDPYGRMNATLGVELPLTNNRVQTTIPFGYIDPPTETMNDDGTPILWKITHNGVDTHPVHFHLYDVQLINRVGWDGAIRPPDANELGWKETVRMKPLEDVVVAFRPTLPKLPFGLPKSRRLLDPSMPEGAISTVDAAGVPTGEGPVFMNILPDGNPIAQKNVMTDFDHEYVWHCHILGHEENDFMRPQIIKDASVIPDPFTLNYAGATGTVTLTWIDNTPVSNPATMGNPKNEIGFRVERSVDAGPFTKIGTALANVTTFIDASLAAGTSNSYRVIAFNAAGETSSNTVSVVAITTAALNNGTVNVPYSQAITATGGTPPYTWSASALPGNLLIDPLSGMISGTPTYVVPANASFATFPVTITVQDAVMTTNVVLNLTINQIAPAAPVIQKPVIVNASGVNLIWAIVPNVSGYNVMRATVTNGVTGSYSQIGSVPANVTTYSDTTFAAAATYKYQVVAFNAAGSTTSASVTLSPAAAPTSLTVPASSSTGTYSVSWGASATAGATYVLQESTDPAFGTFTETVGATSPKAYTGKVNGTYYYRVKAQAPGYLDSGWVSGQCVVLLPPLAPVTLSPSGIVTTLIPTYTWNESLGSTSYQLYVTNAAGIVAINQNIASTICIGGVCTASPGVSLVNGSSYNWNVRASNSAGVSAYSPAKSFTVNTGVPLSTPVATSPTGTIVTVTPSFVWNAVAGATGYQLNVANAAGIVSINQNFNSTICIGGVCTASPGVTLVNGTSYNWTVRASNSAGVSAYSQSKSFTVNTTVPPSIPVTTSPTGTNIPTTPSFVWNESLGSTSYQLYVTTAAGIVVINQNIASTICIGGVCTASPGITLTNATSYNWNVRARNAAGTSAYSPAKAFTTL